MRAFTLVGLSDLVAMADACNGKTMVLVAWGWLYVAHATTVSQRRGTKHVVNARPKV